MNGVPEGWRLGKLEEIVNINYGKDHKKAPLNGNIPVFGSGGLMRINLPEASRWAKATYG